ncbi:MAG: aspartate aminotransferase family protein [Clostridia bacterium]|nr:aspartate aminotransferase family protein [Clostridia bacterium]
MSNQIAPQNHVFYRNQNWHYPKIAYGKGIFLYDDEGNAYIDGCSGSAVANLGHGNSEIAEHAKKQIETIAYTHLSRWTSDPIENCARQIAELTPGDLNHVYFVSGGSEATETAIKMARQFFTEKNPDTSKWKIISKKHSFHGNTLGALSLTGIVDRRSIYDPLLINFPKIPQFYHYRNQWNCQTLYETSVKAAEALEEEILFHGPENIAGFITEPIVGSAAPGIYPDPIYFKMVREICDQYNILLIVDEVMSGFGRTGKMFAIEHFDVVPDLLCIAKGMSSGYTPIGAVVASDKVFNRIMIDGSGQFKHGHTYGGNPLSCSVASKAMEILVRDHIVENAALQGHYLMNKLKTLSTLEMVGDIRGLGLMIGMEFVEDKKTKKSFDTKVKMSTEVTLACFDEGLVVYPGGGSFKGILGDHILIAPPLNITEDEIDQLFEKLSRAIKKVNAIFGGENE